MRMLSCSRRAKRTRADLGFGLGGVLSIARMHGQHHGCDGALSHVRSVGYAIVVMLVSANVSCAPTSTHGKHDAASANRCDSDVLLAVMQRSLRNPEIDPRTDVLLIREMGCDEFVGEADGRSVDVPKWSSGGASESSAVLLSELFHQLETQCRRGPPRLWPADVVPMVGRISRADFQREVAVNYGIGFRTLWNPPIMRVIAASPVSYDEECDVALVCVTTWSYGFGSSQAWFLLEQNGLVWSVVWSWIVWET